MFQEQSTYAFIETQRLFDEVCWSKKITLFDETGKVFIFQGVGDTLEAHQ